MEVFTRVIGVEWNATTDAFKHLVPANYEPGRLTKRKLLSEVAKLFDVLGWCSPAIIIPQDAATALMGRTPQLGRVNLASPAINKVWENWSSKITKL